VSSNLGVTGGDRARHWRTTAIFALWPTIMAAIAAIVHSRDRAGDLVLAAYFGTVSALLFIQAARARREGARSQTIRGAALATRSLIVIGAILVIVVIVSGGRP
jgi:hypothetical protein